MEDKKKIHRNRDNSFLVRLTDAEYKELQKRVAKANCTRQQFVLNSIFNSHVTSQDEVDELSEMNKRFLELNRQISGIANNINQIAHRTNTDGYTDFAFLQELSEQFQEYKKESDVLWQSIRLYQAKGKRTQV